MGQIVALYQTGIVRRLPDPPLPGIDSNKVDASNYAYKRLQTPDALMMVVSYGLTAWLAGAGGEQRHPALALATAAKAVGDVAVGFKLAQEEWGENQALCAYCQVATVASVASAALAIPEAASAVQRLRAA